MSGRIPMAGPGPEPIALSGGLGVRFQVRGRLGQGGMATVYLAYDNVQHAEVALKVLHPHLTGAPGARRRMRRELDAAARVRHPAVLGATALIEDGERLALVMPVCREGTLQDAVEAAGPLSDDALLRLLADIGGALQAAHRVGVLHRDLSPQNVLRRGEGWVLADFGQARALDGATATTTAMGTPGYAPPEAWRLGARDPRIDAYGLGAVLFFAATGAPPFGLDPAAALAAQAAGPPAGLAEARPTLDPRLLRLILALLQPDPALRPGVPEAVALLAPPPPAPARAAGLDRRGLGLALSLAALVVLGWLQDIAPFLLPTIIDGHAIPRADITQMALGLSAILGLPLCWLPALVGALLGRGQGAPRGRVLAAAAVLSGLHLLYVVLGALGMPLLDMGSAADLFGTMMLHQAILLPVSAALVGLSRPWQGLRAPAAPARSGPVAQGEAALLAALRAAAGRQPTPVRLDLEAALGELSAALDAHDAQEAALLVAVDAVAAEAEAAPRTEARLDRAVALGEDPAALSALLSAQQAAPGGGRARSDRGLESGARGRVPAPLEARCTT